jgi:hypothetical protein
MDKEDLKLSFLQRLRLRMYGRVSVGYRQMPGWKGPLEFFAFRCPKHGVQIDYEHGYNHRLDCPEYKKEEKAKEIISN